MKKISGKKEKCRISGKPDTAKGDLKNHKSNIYIIIPNTEKVK